MEKYILELIKDHNRVIIPNFGAFIVSRDKGQTVLFNSFLSFNDGLLINHIGKTDEVDTAVATKKVEAFVNTINSELDLKGVFVMDKLGKFTKDQNGILRFIQNELEEIKKTEAPTKNTTEQYSSADLLDIDTTDVTKVGIIKETIKPSESISKEKLLVIDTPPTDTPTPKPMPQREEKKPVAKPVVPINKPVAQAKVVKEKTQKKRSGLPIWLLTLLILVPILIVLGYFLFFNGDFNPFAKKTPQPAKQTITKEVVKEEPVIEEIPEVVTPIPEITTRQHHIIIGSFKDETNALQLITNLKNKGYNESSILNYQGRFLVSAEWYSSVDKALERQEELLKELQMENWVLTLK